MAAAPGRDALAFSATRKRRHRMTRIHWQPTRLAAIVMACLVTACTGGPIGDHHPEPGDDDGGGEHDGGAGASLDEQLRQVVTDHGLRPHPRPLTDRLEGDARAVARARADLGRLLFFDPLLSGVKQTSCATCHSAEFEFDDGRNIARGPFSGMHADMSQIFCREAPTRGEDGNLAGPDRRSPLNQRNTPTAINTALFPSLMWNGRFHFADASSTDINQLDVSRGFSLPEPEGTMFTRSLLTAQAHIPVTEAVEMTGDAPNFGRPFPPPEIRNDQVRSMVAQRVSGVAAYRDLFTDAYAEGSQITDGDPVVAQGDDVPYLAIADAIAYFEELDLVMTDAPWDDYLAGDDRALSDDAKRGALLFYAQGRCASCHGGDLFSDFKSYNIGVPQVGPGTGQNDLADPAYAGLDTWDFGLEELTGERTDRFKFRTPPLRGVALTAPYMHSGQFATLEDAIRAQVDPLTVYRDYEMTQIEADMQQRQGVKPCGAVFDTANPVAIGPGTAIVPQLSEEEIGLVIEFLKTLTDP